MEKNGEIAFFSVVLVSLLLSRRAHVAYWGKYATTTPQKNRVHYSFCPAGGAMSGMYVKEQHGYGVIDMMLICKRKHGVSAPTYKWVASSTAKSRTVGNSCRGTAFNGATARVQHGFGEFDVKVTCGDKDVPHEPRHYNAKRGMTLNARGFDNLRVFCRANTYPKGIQVHEQYNYGGVNFRLLCS